MPGGRLSGPGLPPPGGLRPGGLPPPGGGLPPPGGGLPPPGGRPGPGPGRPGLPGPGGAPAYGQQPQQQAPQQQAPQQQYQQPAQQQQQQYQQAPQQQQYQQAQQQQQYQQQQQQQPVPVPQAQPEQKKTNIGLIIGIIGGVVAILAVVLFFAFGNKGDDQEGGEDGGEQPVAAVASFNLEITPADATVMVDGKEVEGGAQRVISGLSEGSHKIEVSKGEAFMAFTQDISLSAGQTMPLPIKLQARDVTLTITVDPPAAAVSLLAGATPTEIGKDAATHKYQLKREPGVDYQIKGVAAGYTEISTPLVFTGDPTQEVTVSLVAAGKPGPATTPTAPTPTKTTTKPAKKKNTSPAKPKTAELKIGVAPGNPPATVYVDGKKAGRAPVFVKVSPGSHTVKWKWDDGKSDTQKVKVADKESKLLKGSK